LKREFSEGEKVRKH